MKGNTRYCSAELQGEQIVLARPYIYRVYETAVEVNLRSRKPKLTAVGIRCADHATPYIRLKLALTSPTSGGRSVGTVRLRTKATELIKLRLIIHS
jgi:hypothetical protein